MAVMNFPVNPTVGDKFTNSFGVTYIFTSMGTWDVFNPAVTQDGVELQANKGQPDGYAPLNGAQKLPGEFLNLYEQISTALGVAAPGTSLFAARGDHVHPLPTPAAIGAAPASHTHTASDLSGVATLGSTAGSALGTAAVGTAGTAARSDHVHPLPSLATLGAAPSAHTHDVADTTKAGFVPQSKDTTVTGAGKQSLLIAGSGGVLQWAEVRDEVLPVLNIAPANHTHGLASATAAGFMPSDNNAPDVPSWGGLGCMGMDHKPFWASDRPTLNWIRANTLRAADIDHTHPTIEAAIPKRDMYFEAYAGINQTFTVNTQLTVAFGQQLVPPDTGGTPNDNLPGLWGGGWSLVPYTGSDFVFWTPGTYFVTATLPFNPATTKGSVEIVLQLVDEQLTVRKSWTFNGTIEASGPSSTQVIAIVQASRNDAVRVRATVKGTGGNVTSPVAGRFMQGYKIGS